MLMVALALLAGCKSKQQVAIEQAKQQAALTGQPQQVVSVDKNGTTTTTIQPPTPGGTAQTVTTTFQPATAPAYGIQSTVPNQNAAVATTSPIAAPVPSVDVPAGTSLAIRLNQHISVKTTPAGAPFTGEVVEPVAGVDNHVLIPQGARVEGIVDASHRRGHFKGRSILELRLTALYLNGNRYPIDTHDVARTKKGKGKRSAAFIGGGAGVGMLIGGVAGGGVGLLAGGLAGAGAGTALGGLTGNRDLDIPAESIIRFKLADDIVLQR